MHGMRAILFGGGLSLLISLIGTRYAIRVLSARGYGQEIRDDGPTTHHTKRGTPTMGGIVIILATVVGYAVAKIITGQLPTASALLLLFLFVGIGLVGFLDDFIKNSRQRNLGLRSRAKIIGQTVVAVAFGFLALSPALEDERGVSPASHHISFIRDYERFALPTILGILLIWVIVTASTASPRAPPSWSSPPTRWSTSGRTASPARSRRAPSATRCGIRSTSP